ncbi:MAG: zf-HC2 domain-containing protein [Gemmatimonadaceae bacterium]
MSPLTEQQGARWGCDEVVARVYDFLDGELPGAEDLWVRDHLVECGPCLRRFEHERRFLRRVAGPSHTQPASDELRRRIRRDLDAERSTPADRGRLASDEPGDESGGATGSRGP